MRHQWTEGSAERQRMAAEVVQLRTDLKETAENHQRCLKDVSQMTLEVNTVFKLDPKKKKIIIGIKSFGTDPISSS